MTILTFVPFRHAAKCDIDSPISPVCCSAIHTEYRRATRTPINCETSKKENIGPSVSDPVCTFERICTYTTLNRLNLTTAKNKTLFEFDIFVDSFARVL